LLIQTLEVYYYCCLYVCVYVIGSIFNIDAVFHGSELVFVFDDKSYDYIPLPWTPAERTLQQQFVDMWVAFAHTGTFVQCIFP
jgi:carboxylesterase type B